MTSGVIGSLRHRVTIERPQRTADIAGTATIEWIGIANVYARIEATNGREIGIADGIAGRASHKVLIRYRDDVLPEMRFLAGNRHLEIRAALDIDGRRRWLQCLCEEQLP